MSVTRTSRAEGLTRMANFLAGADAEYIAGQTRYVAGGNPLN